MASELTERAAALEDGDPATGQPARWTEIKSAGGLRLMAAALRGSKVEAEEARAQIKRARAKGREISEAAWADHR